MISLLNEHSLFNVSLDVLQSDEELLQRKTAVILRFASADGSLSQRLYCILAILTKYTLYELPAFHYSLKLTLSEFLPGRAVQHV